VELTEGTLIADRFRLERPLGQGGMGAVWLARHLSLDIPCALKFLHPEGAESGELRARFEREAKAAAKLRCANVVQILDHGLWNGTPYIAMELLVGEDLDVRLQRRRTLTARETVMIVAQAARALSRAHAVGLVHRDLKPANLFLVRDDDREIVKVLDFGVAKQTVLDVGGSQTKTGAIMGTPYYMSPEQARGVKEIDHRTDLWALGVIAYQCLVGRLPFESDALGDLFMLIMAEPLPVPSKMGAVPAGFDAWWVRAMARSPGERFQSAREMSDALAIALGVSVATNELEPDLGGPGGSRNSDLGALGGSTQLFTGAPPLVAPSPRTVTAVAAEVPPPPPNKASRPRGALVVVAGLLLGAMAVGGGFFALRGQISANGAAGSSGETITTGTLIANANGTGMPVTTVSAAAGSPEQATTTGPLTAPILGSTLPVIKTATTAASSAVAVAEPTASARPATSTVAVAVTESTASARPAASVAPPAKVAPGEKPAAKAVDAARPQPTRKPASKQTATHDDGI
jgi:serine/threonine-protein kinase